MKKWGVSSWTELPLLIFDSLQSQMTIEYNIIIVTDRGRSGPSRFLGHTTKCADDLFTDKQSAGVPE